MVEIKRIVILGHNGFIGTHLYQALKASYPDVEVVGKSFPEVDLTRRESAATLLNLFDLNTAVIMCAAIKRQVGDNLDVFAQNQAITLNLCHLLENHPVQRFIYFSSSAVYGEDVHNTNITEETLVCPTSYYGMNKYISERLYSKVIGSREQSSLVMLRPPTIYGPGDMGNAYGPVGFLNSALEGKEITLWGDGTELREFLFIKDIVEVVSCLTFRDQEGVINVTCGQSHNFKDILNIIEKFVSRELDLTSRPRSKDKVDNAFCNKRFKEWLPDFQFTSLEEGVKQTLGALETQKV